MTLENMMQITLRVIAGSILAIWSYVAIAQPAPPAAPQNQQQSFGPGELVDAGQRFFGGVSQGFAGVIEKATSQWGLPNGYVLRRGGRRRLHRRPALRRRHALHQECRRSQSVLAGPHGRLRFRRGWRADNSPIS
jgi:hypothetical protein